ncbi:hypothetical protein IGI04_031014 [Brassica rapa subsp. trilocularis]|uniref:Cytochrome P450 n=1 Tax=Brassica rapa subsp. trilocularis TaxID=1813537 RepID=A0ABQ7LV05_BRACM|nr:hypothetical protein IGI04_031014 [Brassica rapa subsp. trilocularis]
MLLHPGGPASEILGSKKCETWGRSDVGRHAHMVDVNFFFPEIYGYVSNSNDNAVGVLRYRVELVIADDTAEGAFGCFDGVMTKLHNLRAAEAGVNPEDVTMPPFITDMEGKKFTFQVRVNTYNFTAHHQTFTITHILTEHERVPVPDYVVDGGTMVMMPICRTVTEFLNRLWNNRSSGNFKNQDQQQIHVGRLSTKGGNDATRLRFIDPLWKLKWFLNIGSQARLKKSIATIDKFVYRLIITKRKEQNTAIREDILSRFLVEREKDPERMNDKYLRDIILSFDRWEGHNRCISLLIRDVTSSHEETTDGKGFVESIDEEALDQMQYLHAALSETLRLYTAVPVSEEKGNVYYISYAIGRMTYIWGQQAEEFKPERWLKDGVFQPESPFKFISFHAGPGICTGKDFAYRQMKIVSMALLHFRIVDEKNLISNSKVGEKNEQGLYRVDNESMRDNNSWLTQAY